MRQCCSQHHSETRLTSCPLSKEGQNLKYTTEELNRSNGELEEKSLGNWVTVTEYGKMKGVGSRQVRTILAVIGLLVEEMECGADSTKKRYRRRLSQQAVDDGLGKRHYPKNKGTYPFDVLSPKGQLWCDQRWDGAVEKLLHEGTQSPTIVDAANQLTAFKQRRRCPEEFTLQEEVCWLLDHFPDILSAEICQVTSSSKQVVSGYRKIRKDQLRRWEALKLKQLPDHGHTFSSHSAEAA